MIYSYNRCELLDVRYERKREVYLNTQISILKSLKKQKENPKDEAIGKVGRSSGRRDCKKLRFTIYELRLINPKSKIRNPK